MNSFFHVLSYANLPSRVTELRLLTFLKAISKILLSFRAKSRNLFTTQESRCFDSAQHDNFGVNLFLRWFLIIVIFSSCKTAKKTALTDTTPKASLDFKSARVLANNLKKNEFSFEWLNAKFNCEAKIDSTTHSFKVAMRAKKDSIMWFSISPAMGIEVVRAVITKDSLKMINRLNSTYFTGGLNYISKILQADLDYESVQSLLIGNSTEFYDEDEKLRSSIDNKKYVLSTIRKRKLKKAIEKNKEIKDPVQSIWLDPNTFKITQLLFKDFNTNREFQATYNDFKLVDSTNFSYNIQYNIKAEKNVQINIEYTKVEKGEPQKFPFTIPEKYEPIYYKEK